MGLKDFLYIVLIISIVGFFFVYHGDKFNICNQNSSSVESESKVVYQKLYFVNDINIKETNFSKFFRNNTIPENIYNDIVTHCFKDHVVNIPCVSYYLSNEYNFEYKKDNFDYMKTTEEFLRDKGGDCEDYTIFFYYLIWKYSKEEGINKVLCFQKEKCHKEVVYRKGSIENIVKNVRYREVNNIKKMGGVCFKVNENLGHCVLFINDKLIDPQNGECVGELLNRDYAIYEGKKVPVMVLFNENDIHIKKWQFWK
jgi:hypothetical protein